MYIAILLGFCPPYIIFYRQCLYPRSFSILINNPILYPPKMVDDFLEISNNFFISVILRFCKSECNKSEGAFLETTPTLIVKSYSNHMYMLGYLYLIMMQRVMLK